MNRTVKLYALIFVIVLGILAVLELSKKEILDWRKSYDTEKKTPFGLYVFDQEIKNILGNEINKVNISPYEYYHGKESNGLENILVIEKEIDKESQKKILKQVAAGSDLMIISDHPIGLITDSLKLGYSTSLNYEDVNILKLTDSRLKNDSIIIDKLPGRRGFSSINDKIEILGYTESKDSDTKKLNKDGASFMKIKFGKGNIYIHKEPLFITNYYLLKPGNDKYAAGVFSYLSKRKTVWFTDISVFSSSSLLRFVLLNPPLKYAWWLFLSGILIFILFNAKRKQRVVPIIEPLQNKSADFVKSIGNLYLQEGDFHDMMAKKSQYFLQRVRSELLIDTQNLDEIFINKLELKTGKETSDIINAVSLIKKSLDPYSTVLVGDLEKLNQLLDKIYPVK